VRIRLTFLQAWLRVTGSYGGGDNSWAAISDGFVLGMHQIPASRVNSPAARRVSNFELGSHCLLQQSSVSDFGPLLPRCYFRSKWSKWSKIDGAPGFENQFQADQGQTCLKPSPQLGFVLLFSVSAGLDQAAKS
jgi:hypothetical protein